MSRRLIDADAFKQQLQIAEGVEIDRYGNIHTNVNALNIALERSAIDAEPQWILCSERLPQNMEPVNITWVNREPVPYYMHIKDKPFTATGIYFKGKWYWWSSTCDDILCEYGQNEIDEVVDGIDIVAWMPLPKPYEVNHE